MGKLQTELQRLILESQISMSELERRSSVSRSVLSRFMSGERSVTLETADQLISALDAKCSLDTKKPSKDVKAK